MEKSEKVSENIKGLFLEASEKKQLLESPAEPVASINAKTLMHIIYILASEVDNLQDEITELKNQLK